MFLNPSMLRLPLSQQNANCTEREKEREDNLQLLKWKGEKKWFKISSAIVFRHISSTPQVLTETFPLSLCWVLGKYVEAINFSSSFLHSIEISLKRQLCPVLWSLQECHSDSISHQLSTITVLLHPGLSSWLGAHCSVSEQVDGCTKKVEW